MRKGVAAFLVASIALIVSGCSTTVGKGFPVDNASRIRPGVTQAEVTALLGQPYRRTTEAGEEKWIYMSYTTTGVPAPTTLVPHLGQIAADPPVYSRSDYRMVTVTFENAIVKSCTKNFQTQSGGSDPSNWRTTGSTQACAASL
jgi:outer membrane protein assembly factor BamE (lipoprotein component of BamABCDE complex)